MASFALNVVGLEGLLKKMESKGEEIKEQVFAEVEGTAWNITEKAKERVPKNYGGGQGLLGSISMKTIDEATHEVVVQKYYAPFVEFGTGAQAANYLSSQDPELRAYAMQFYVNGQGRMAPRPFLFNSFEEEKKKLLERLREIIKQ
jgi:HK97 gp10 family phage protein